MKPIIDISYYQQPSVIDYDKLSNEVSGVILRAGYGTGVPGKWQGRDTTFERHYAEFTKRGVPLGAYHFITEYQPMNEQVKVFIDAVKGKNLKLGYWCDVEYELGAERLTAKSVIGWMNGVEAVMGECGVYAANWCWRSIMGVEYARYSNRKLWCAAYTKEVIIPPGWDKYWLWQYTSSGRLNGYGGNLDMNKFGGSDAEFQAWIGGNVSIYPKLVYPLPMGIRISQLFGERPEVYTTSKGHNGVDWACAVGTPIYAMQDGVVIRAADFSQPGITDGKIGYGRHVRIQHPEGVSIYGHLSKLMVQEGDQVKAGQQIGLSGGATSDPNSGMSTGAHLHGEYRMDGIKNPVPGGYVYNAIDILPLLNATPVEPEPLPEGTVRTLVNLNIRKGAGTSFPRWATAPKGTLLDVLEVKGDWVRVGWNQWCMKQENGVKYIE